MHRADARLKIAGLFAFTVLVFAVPHWWMLGVLAVVAISALVVARVPFGLVNRLLVPVYVLAAFSFACNVAAHPGVGGLGAGAYFALRMVVLVAGSFAVCLTTTATELLDAFRQIASPLRAVRVPVDDIAFTLALSVRFIPVIAQEFAVIRSAQRARGADDSGSPARAARVWANAFSALFVGLFRHADTLASAMDARCYGASPDRTRLK